LNSRVYLVLDVFPMFSLFETHLNYLSTLRGALHIVNDLEYDTVKSFIEKAISGIPVHAITTDHRREYKSIMDELKN